MNSESTAMESGKEITSITILEDDIPEIEAIVTAFSVLMSEHPELTEAQRDRIEKRFNEEIMKQFIVSEKRIRRKLGENKE
jgi:hypothetical protein